MKYAELSNITLDLARPLGNGTDGMVWKSNEGTAVKALEREIGYYNERDSYLRLEEFGFIQRIEGFWVPYLINYSDELWVIEMDVVAHPPYIIDFAKVRIDRPPDFSEETVLQNEEKCLELFGDNWPLVLNLMATLESIGIYYLDPQPGNIVFPDMD